MFRGISETARAESRHWVVTTCPHREGQSDADGGSQTEQQRGNAQKEGKG